MRFRSWLPLLQTAAILLFVWAPWAPAAHQIVALAPDGSEFKIWILIPIEASEWDQAINLPVAAIVRPIEFAVRRPGALENSKLLFHGYWLVGLLCWYMVGRLVDDLVTWQRTKVLPRKNPADLTFALLAMPSSILLAGAFTFDRVGGTVFVIWGAIWLVLSSTALIFRSWQYIRQRRRPYAS